MLTHTTIGDAIRQENFVSELIKADINISYTYSHITAQKNNVLKKYGISIQQFNILRILKGRKGNPASIKLLTERMIDKMSNASRLVEKLRTKGYVDRATCADDRRQVEICITNKGTDVIDKASVELEEIIHANRKITEEEAAELNRILDKMRN